MKNSVGFSVSRILGAYPFDDYGPSKKWLYISVCSRMLPTLWSIKSFIDYINDDDNIIVTMLSLLWVVVVRVIPLVHLVCVSRNRTFFERTQPVLNQKMPLYCELMFTIGLIYYTVLLIDLDWLPNNSILTSLLFVWDFTLNDLIRFQYVVIIEAESKRIERLKHRVETRPVASCSQLYVIANSVGEVHNMFTWQLLIIMIGIVQSLVTEPIFVYDDPSLDFKFIVSFLEIVAEGLWALTIVHPCSRFNAQVIDILFAVPESESMFAHKDMVTWLFKKVRAFYEELFRVMRSSDHLVRNKKLVLCLLLEKSASFTIFGLFSLGYPLLGSVIAAATSFFGFFTSMYNTAE